MDNEAYIQNSTLAIFLVTVSANCLKDRNARNLG